MSFLTDLLEHYHLTLKDLGERARPGSFSRLSTPYEDASFKAVVARLEKAIADKEKIVLYGDYDVDGLTSTAILKSALDQRKANSGFFIPSRYHEGYGLNAERVKQFAERGYTLLVTLDNGISQKAEIDLAHSYGMQVIVIDHHDLPKELPSFDYCFHHKLSKFIDYDCSAASLSFFVASALLHKYDDYLASLAGLAVFSDVMPLIGNNLELAKIAKQNIALYRYSNLAPLLGDGELTYESLSFSLIPALNAVGRIEKDSLSTNNACRLLLERKNEAKIEKYSQAILSSNAKKKEIIRNITFLPQYELSTAHGYVGRVDSYAGLSGLFANKLLREKNAPVALFAPSDQDENLLVGSLRAPEGYRVDTFLEKNKARFLASGGHEKAAGLTIKKSDYYQVATLFLSECEKQALEKKESVLLSIPMALDDLNEENYSVYEEFMPFGEGFPAPTFSIEVPSEKLSMAPSGKVLNVFSDNGEGKITAFPHFEGLGEKRYSSYRFEGSFRKETFRSKTSYILRAEKIIPLA